MAAQFNDFEEGQFSDVEDDDFETNQVQTGRGEKRKNESDQESESEDEQSEDEQGQYYYQIESRRKYHSKKFGMTATDHRVRFNNVLADRDLLESYETTHKIIHHLLEDVKEGMAPNDQVRFILRSEQLETPISLPFMPVERLTTERVYSALERVIQSNQEFRLNDTVTIDLNHVLAPVGSGRKKRTTYNIDDYLSEKGSVVRIKNNDDDMCLARALVVARAKKDNDPRYNQIRNSKNPIQREKAFDLHEAANVPLGPCGLNEVALFQQYLVGYQIVIISGDHNQQRHIIHPHPRAPTRNHSLLYIYITTILMSLTAFQDFCVVVIFVPGVLNPIILLTDHLCSAMCRCCRGFDCKWENDGIVCRECKRLFKSRTCYDRHKTEPINSGGKTVCQVIRVCEKCDKAMHINKINSKGHICGRKCRTCGVVITREDTDHKCYMQPLEQDEDSSYNHMLFFDFEATQEHGIHQPNLCVVHDEEGEVALFQGKDTVKDFCEWLFTEQHEGCIVGSP